MSDLNITITGLNELLDKVALLPSRIQEEVGAEILDSVMRINKAQRRKVPKDQGGLARGIGYQRHQENNRVWFEIFSNAENSAYMEFGTKGRVVIPAGLEEVAAAARGRGITSKLKAKEAIFAWAKRKGIKKEAWYAIFVSIMRNGIKPHPFFFQPFFDEQDKLLKRIQDLLNENGAL